MLDLRDDQVMEAIHRYIKFYIPDGISMAEIFPGIEELIDELKHRGYSIGLATMMEEGYAKQTLNDYGLLGKFDSVKGASLKIALSKYDLIKDCMREVGASPQETIMIGDGEDDHNSAVKADVRFVAAIYGYGIDRQYCIDKNIEFIEKPLDLLNLL